MGFSSIMKKESINEKENIVSDLHFRLRLHATEIRQNSYCDGRGDVNLAFILVNFVSWFVLLLVKLTS